MNDWKGCVGVSEEKKKFILIPWKEILMNQFRTFLGSGSEFNYNSHIDPFNQSTQSKNNIKID